MTHPTPEFTPELREGDVLNQKYELVRRLGIGGMGTVYEAHELGSGAPLAVKVLHPEYASCTRAVQRFLRESTILARLPPEHLVPVIDVGEVLGVPYFTMELLQGADLRHLLRRSPQLPVSRAVRLMLDVCRGSSAAHAAGFVHRDIKPANIFVTLDGAGKELAKLLDFGVAKLRGIAGGTEEGALVGTIGYMAPEQVLSSRDVDERADIYSLGAILYEALAGARAYAAKGLNLLYSVLGEDPLPLGSHRPDLPEGLIRVVARAMARSPDERFANVKQFADGLRPFVDEEALGHSLTAPS